MLPPSRDWGTPSRNNGVTAFFLALPGALLITPLQVFVGVDIADSAPVLAALVRFLLDNPDFADNCLRLALLSDAVLARALGLAVE